MLGFIRLNHGTSDGFFYVIITILTLISVWKYFFYHSPTSKTHIYNGSSIIRDVVGNQSIWSKWLSES